MRHRSYDELASEYDRRWRKYVDASLAFGIEDVPLTQVNRLLDVACGTGALEVRLAKQIPGLALHSADLSLPMLRRARTKVLARRATWTAADANALPYANESFDCVFCFNALHYFADPARCVTEFARVLVPGGQLWLMDWCDDYWTCKLCSVWLRMFEPAFQNTFGLAEAHALLMGNGFEVTQSERRRISPLWGLMRLHAVRA
jgi:ubiquinone/menaquinone biosynthesis C-methylase UbiE